MKINNISTKKYKRGVIREFSLKRTRLKIVRFVDSNPDLNTLVILTFKENISDLSEANSIFKNFIKRLKRQVPNLKYLAVPGFQARGVVHYHVLFNFEGESKKLANIWGQGFVMINKIKNVNFFHDYVTKYISKEFIDLRFFGMRKMLSSQKKSN
jgi:hypothetical protein